MEIIVLIGRVDRRSNGSETTPVLEVENFKLKWVGLTYRLSNSVDAYISHNQSEHRKQIMGGVYKDRFSPVRTCRRNSPQTCANFYVTAS